MKLISTSTPELDLLASLRTWTVGPFLTVYLPFDPTRRDIEREELKSAVHSAHRALVETGLSEAAATELVEPITLQPVEGVEHCRGIAWFCSPGHAVSLRLLAPQGPSVRVGTAPDTLGVAPQLATLGHWFVLALSQNRVRLFRADQHAIEELAVEGLPQRMDDALWFIRREPTMERHGSGAMHVTDSGRQLHKDDVRRFLHMIDEAIAPVLAGGTAPLVVMGVGYETAMFISDTHYRHVAPTAVIGNPDRLDAGSVHERSRPLVAQSGRRDELLAMAHELAGTGRVVSMVSEVAAACEHGVVQDLLVAREATVVPAGDGPLDDQRALLAQAFTTAVTAGVPFVVADRHELPVDADMVAVLRY